MPKTSEYYRPRPRSSREPCLWANAGDRLTDVEECEMDKIEMVEIVRVGI